jgi:AcrR family transcriptional regulator
MMQPDPKKQDMLRRMADHVLANGLHNASLRPLAAAAGTSDRMLIYHFATKDALLAEILRFIAGDLSRTLTERFAATDDRRTVPMLRALWAAAKTEEMRPVMRIWLELAAVASREGGAKQQIANAIADGFLEWTGANLANPDDAGFALTLFEGMLVLGEVGHAETVAAALDRLDQLTCGPTT